VSLKEGGGLWDPARSHLRVVLRDVVTEARVGLHPWEQHPERPTRLIVNVEMFAPLPQGLQAESTAGLVDYDHIRAALKAWPARPHTPLLETLLDELAGLCFRNPRVEACRVSVVKPDIFNEAAAAGVEAYILRADYPGASR
jgi:dihydroneopterin aldolase